MIFIGIFSVLVFFPSAEGNEYVVEKNTALKVVIMQTIIWCGVACRIHLATKSRQQNHQVEK